MGAKELIEVVRRRLTGFRRLNFILAHLLTICVVTVIVRLFSRGMIPSPFELPIAALGALVVLTIFQRTTKWVRGYTSADAASLLDQELNGKERFLTLATSPKKVGENLDIIEEQSAALGTTYSPNNRVRFSLEQPTRASLVGTACLLPILFLLWGNSSRASLSPGELQLSSLSAEELRNINATNPSIPLDVQSRIEALAEAIEENGYYSDAALTSLDETLHAVEQVTNLSLPPPPPAEAPEMQPPPNTPETTPPPTGSQSSSSSKDNGSEGEKASSSENSSSPSEEKKDQEGEQGKSATSDDSQKQEKESGAKAPNENSDNASDDSARQKEGPGQGTQDPKKDVTGVGEGHGKGKAGEQKDQHGETQSGKDQGGTKEGDAEHPEEDAKSGGKQSDGKDDAKEKDSSAANAVGKRSPSSTKPEGEKSDLSGVKDKLEQMKNDMEKGPSQGKDDSENKQEISRQGEGGKSNPEEKKGEGDKGSGSKEQQGEKNKEGEQRAGEKESQDGKSGEGKQNEQNSKPGKTTPEGKLGEKSGESKAGEQKDDPSSPSQQSSEKSPSPDAGKSDREGADSPDLDKNTKSPRPEKLPTPGEHGNRLGPFEGGDEGAIDISKATKQQVTVPLEERIDVRSVGAEDQKLYRNAPGSKAKTNVSNEDFTKPTADDATRSQPIPVEYKDLLR